MNESDSVAVCSRSFSKNGKLRRELEQRYKYVRFNDEGLSLSEDELIDFLKGHNKTIVGLEKIDRDLLLKVSELKVISKYGVGTDNLDLVAMRDLSVFLGLSPGVNRRAVSELVLCLTILMSRNVPQANIDVKNGSWNQFKGNQISGKTFGIVGLGQIGQDLVKLLKPFECEILVHDVVELENQNSLGFKQVSLDELLVRSDIISLHLPFNEGTRNIINDSSFKQMKKSSILINLSRGGIVNEEDLKVALLEDQIHSAAFDVFLEEPPKDKVLINLPNFFATPHIGGISQEGIEAMGMAAINGLDDNFIP